MPAVDGADPAVAADHDRDRSGSVDHRVGGDEVGGQALADPRRVDLDTWAELDDHRLDVDGDVIDPRRALGNLTGHRRVVGTAGRHRRLGHRLQ